MENWTDSTVYGEGAGIGATLNVSTIFGHGAGARCTANGVSLYGDSCGIDGNFFSSEIRGQYAARKAFVQNSVIDGYAAAEYAYVVHGSLTGLYAGHSMWGSYVCGTGESAFSMAIVTNSVAHGHYAGIGAEGDNLTMIGDNVTTARVPGSQMQVTQILVNDPDIPWVIPNHPFGSATNRVNLFVYGDVMPTLSPSQGGAFYQGGMCPFTVLDANSVQYTGNKYKALTAGLNVRVAQNTCKPHNSVAIGAGSVITASNQIVINGRVI